MTNEQGMIILIVVGVALVVDSWAEWRACKREQKNKK